MGADYKYIGKTMARRDAEDIVTGAVQYTDDLKFQNLLCGKVLTKPLCPCRDQEDRQEQGPGFARRQGGPHLGRHPRFPGRHTEERACPR